VPIKIGRTTQRYHARVIKSTVILVLLLALLLGAGLSRPGQSDFERDAAGKLTETVKPKNVIERVFGEPRTVDLAARCEYKNRLLWADVYLDGKHLATGAFGRWFWSDEGKLRMSPKA
jgi:hypothetical protein